MTIHEREYLAEHLIQEFTEGRLERRQRKEIGITEPTPLNETMNLNIQIEEVDQFVMDMVKRVMDSPRTTKLREVHFA